MRTFLWVKYGHVTFLRLQKLESFPLQTCEHFFIECMNFSTTGKRASFERGRHLLSCGPFLPQTRDTCPTKTRTFLLLTKVHLSVENMDVSPTNRWEFLLLVRGHSINVNTLYGQWRTFPLLFTCLRLSDITTCPVVAFPKDKKTFLRPCKHFCLLVEEPLLLDHGQMPLPALALRAVVVAHGPRHLLVVHLLRSVPANGTKGIVSSSDPG